MAQNILLRSRDVIQSGKLDAIPLARKKFDQLLAPLCDRFRLTRNELDVLLFLFNNPGFDRAADIVRIRHIAKSHVSLSVGNLEQRGFLTRTYDPDDRRNAHLKLTGTGLEIAREGALLQEQFFDRVFAGLTEEELALWRSILDRVCTNISTM